MQSRKSFLLEYVRSINEATFNVPIRDVRIGSAKYSRLAQINLRTRVITFSRYAIENVSDKGRRLLVLHELAHVLEPRHNARFWRLVAKYEPDYRQVDKQLLMEFNDNVRKAELSGRIQEGSISLRTDGHCEEVFDVCAFDGPQDESGVWLDAAAGVIFGGS